MYLGEIIRRTGQEKQIVWEYQEIDVSLLRAFSSKPGIPNPTAFSSRPRYHMCLNLCLKDSILHILNFVEHLLYVILLLFSLLTLNFKVVGVPHLIE